MKRSELTKQLKIKNRRARSNDHSGPDTNADKTGKDTNSDKTKKENSLAETPRNENTIN